MDSKTRAQLNTIRALAQAGEESYGAALDRIGAYVAGLPIQTAPTTKTDIATLLITPREHGTVQWGYTLAGTISGVETTGVLYVSYYTLTALGAFPAPGNGTLAAAGPNVTGSGQFYTPTATGPLTYAANTLVTTWQYPFDVTTGEFKFIFSETGMIGAAPVGHGLAISLGISLASTNLSAGANVSGYAVEIG
jgi:hypothetical protein